MARIFSGDLRHPLASGRSDRLGRHAPDTSCSYRARGRSAFAARWSLVVAYGLDAQRAIAPSRSRETITLRDGPVERSILCLAYALAFPGRGRVGRDFISGRRLEFRFMGRLRAYSLHVARDLVGQLSRSFLGFAAFRDARRFAQQLVGRSDQLRRGLA